MNRRYRRSARPRLEILEERLVMSAVTPVQSTSAYGLDAISFAKGAIKGNGAGQTIAIIGAYHSPSFWSDLKAFDARYGLPDLALTAPDTAVRVPNGLNSLSRTGFLSVVNFAGSATNPTWNMESALDVQMVHATAPAANIILVEARTGNLGDLIAAINAAKTIPSVSVISMSWGGPEFNGQQQLDGLFTTPVGHVGITFVASSGDDGAGAQWPASSPNVVGVGGTSLTVTTAGARGTESAWSGSGGAISTVVPKPNYQASALAGKFRGAPDVSFVADPGTGLTIVSGGVPMGVGGTSMSAPGWAGLIAIADQGRVVAGKSILDGATQTLPSLYKAPAGSFFDVKTGPRATTGYDTSTGLGSPNAPTLVAYLAGSAVSVPNTVWSDLGQVIATTSSKAGSTTTAGPALASGSVTPPAPLVRVEKAEWPTLVPNLVALKSPNVFTKHDATDAFLETWGLA